MKPFKPMLAGTPQETDFIRLPVLASPKMDGVRAVVRDGVVLSRSLKPIPNLEVQQLYGRADLEGLDGELIVRPHDAEVFRRTTSVVMSIDKPFERAGGCFYVFDDSSDPEEPFHVRMAYAEMTALVEKVPGLHAVRHVPITTYEDLDLFESQCLAAGYEGIMTRDPQGRYKFGRSTAKEQGLLKVKRFADGEAEVLGVIEKMHNANEATTNALGRTERSHHQAGMVPAGTMGALRVRDLKTGVEFEIGSGFTDADRDYWWTYWAGYLGDLDRRIVKYKHFPQGSKDKPRFPIYLGIRDPKDMS